MPRCVPPPSSPHANSHKPVGLRMHPPSLDQPAPSKPSRWDHLFSSSPEKVSDTSREIRIVAAPAHLLPPSEIGRLQHRAAKGPHKPAALLPCLSSVIFSDPNAHEACFSCGAAVDGISRQKWAASTTAALPFLALFCLAPAHPSFSPSILAIPWGQLPYARKATSFSLLSFFLLLLVLLFGDRAV